MFMSTAFHFISGCKPLKWYVVFLLTFFLAFYIVQNHRNLCLSRKTSKLILSGPNFCKKNSDRFYFCNVLQTMNNRYQCFASQPCQGPRCHLGIEKDASLKLGAEGGSDFLLQESLWKTCLNNFID